MVPANVEYLTIVAVLTLYICTSWSSELGRLVRTRQFWLASLIFFSGSIALEVTGKYMRWWWFSEVRITGLMFLGVPVEDYVLLLLIFLMTVASWESSRGDDLA